MNDEATILSLAASLASAGEPFVLATVVEARGSTPRNAGAKLVWRPGAGLSGTVGGGHFESLVIDAARSHFERRSAGVESFALGAEAEQCCGGAMDVFFEFVGTRQRLVVFGAGHVGEALVRVLDGASLEIVVADDRADWNSEARFPGRRRVLDLDEATRLALERPETTLACVMTYSHDIDFDIVCELAGAEPPPAFVGLIGSRTKAACFRTRFESRGLTGEQIGRIHCPIGVGDLGKTPLEVAISVAAQVLGVCRRLELDGAGGVAGERAGSETTWTVG